MKATNTNSRKFISFNEISINGEIMDSFYIEQYDLDYNNIIILLNISYKDIRSIEFNKVSFLLQEDITKRSIFNTFLELRSKKPIEKITIKELSELAFFSQKELIDTIGRISERMLNA